MSPFHRYNSLNKTTTRVIMIFSEFKMIDWIFLIFIIIASLLIVFY
jgi:energy-coupling factor transporter transmembrane protein EcfT